jgi:hypothetical protein
VAEIEGQVQWLSKCECRGSSLAVLRDPNPEYRHSGNVNRTGFDPP